MINCTTLLVHRNLKRTTSECDQNKHYRLVNHMTVIIPMCIRPTTLFWTWKESPWKEGAERETRRQQDWFDESEHGFLAARSPLNLNTKEPLWKIKQLPSRPRWNVHALYVLEWWTLHFTTLWFLQRCYLEERWAFVGEEGKLQHACFSLDGGSERKMNKIIYLGIFNVSMESDLTKKVNKKKGIFQSTEKISRGEKWECQRSRKAIFLFSCCGAFMLKASLKMISRCFVCLSFAQKCYKQLLTSCFSIFLFTESFPSSSSSSSSKLLSAFLSFHLFECVTHRVGKHWRWCLFLERAAYVDKVLEKVVVERSRKRERESLRKELGLMRTEESHGIEIFSCWGRRVDKNCVDWKLDSRKCFSLILLLIVVVYLLRYLKSRHKLSWWCLWLISP